MSASRRSTRTPRPYLSWSQLDLIERDPEAYREKYFYGRQDEETDPQRFGKEFAEAMEDESRELEIAEMCRIFLPRYKNREFKIEVSSPVCPLHAKLDGYDEENGIGEHKTGTVPWTQKRADQHGQLTFYAYAHLLKYGRLPKRIRLHWIETKRDEEREIVPTGRIETFETTRSTIDFLKLHARIEKAWNLILQMSKEENKKLEAIY